MNRTRKPIVAGILCIIAGIIGLIPAIWVAGLLALAGGGWLRFIGIPLIVMGIVPIVGGIYALRRRIWGLALAGSIFALIVPITLVVLAMSLLAAGLSEGLSPLPAIREILARVWPLIVGFGVPGVLAIILLTRGKCEFK